jgi:hypothetical protein
MRQVARHHTSGGTWVPTSTERPGDRGDIDGFVGA